ncbi:MAG: alkaline phosphatase family protein [Candidatus Obscuribacterales bacterium]|nr:alkaline phosphatase family protein [Candidatus Obscuribacterales bacterium]
MQKLPPSTEMCLIRSRKVCIAVITVLLCCLSVVAPSDAAASEVRLVLQITIDQLRGDLPLRFRNRFLPNGFRYLMDRGTYFSNAHYLHADTETGPGHATLVTGGQPAQHGIVGGDWWDEAKKKIVYSVEDENFPAYIKALSKQREQDPIGRAPTNLLSTTIGDEIYLASEQKSKVFAISGKDRSAIIPGGRVGKAFWLANGDFATSSFYYKTLPPWLADWNNKKLADSYRNKSWNLLKDRSTYWRKDRDDLPYEGTYKHLGRTMPKRLGSSDDYEFYRGLDHTIVSDELVLAFAKDLITREQLGKSEATDYLSLSFSSTDLIGHTWGVGSLEAEDNMLRVDQNLADLFTFVNKTIGLDKTLIVLSADHGVGEVTEQLQSLGFPATRIDPNAFTDHISKSLKSSFSTELDLLRTFVYPYLYLNPDNVKKLALPIDKVERAAAEASMSYPGISFAATRSDIIQGRLPSGQSHMLRIANTFYSKRSGNVHLVADQNAVLMHHPWHEKAGLHGSVWTYDTYVPIMFAGPGVPSQTVARLVGPHDIVPTIANILGIKPPSGSVGTVLTEIADCRAKQAAK